MTTFTTPFCIMAAEPAYRVIRRLLPQSINDWLDRYTEKNIGTRDSADWTEFLKEYFTRMLIFTTLLTAIALFAEYYLSGYLRNNLQLPYADIITAVLTFIIMAPLLRAVLVNRTSHPELFSALWFQKRSNHIPLVVLILLKVIVAAGFIFFVFAQILGLAEIFAAAGLLHFVLRLADGRIPAHGIALSGQFKRTPHAQAPRSLERSRRASAIRLV